MPAAARLITVLWVATLKPGAAFNVSTDRLNATTTAQTAPEICKMYPDEASCNSDPFCSYDESDSRCASCPFGGNTCYGNSDCCSGAGCEGATPSKQGVCTSCRRLTTENACCSGYYWNGAECRVFEKVHIGMSDGNTKCQTLFPGLICDKDGGNRGKRANTDSPDAYDAFLISVKDSSVCAKRTDTDFGGWGQHLAVWCKLRGCEDKTTADDCATCTGYYWTGSKCKGAEQVVIGKSDNHSKCVSTWDKLSCEQDAGNRGKRANTDNWGADDSFAISVSGNLVCAKRLDQSGGWDQQLAIWCRLAEAVDTELV